MTTTASSAGHRHRVLPTARGRRRRRRRALAVLGVLALSALLLGIALFAATPSVANAEARVRQLSAAHGVTDQGGVVPTRFAAALVATEDGRYYHHHGVDLVALARVAWGWATGANGDQGGSTLDQQLAKGLYGDGRGGLLDKATQATLGVKLDASYGKAQVLEMYAASVYFGHGFYGLDAAACGYFATPPDRLSWAQASLLAGLPQAPSAYDPFLHPRLARERQRQVLGRLVAVGDLTAAEAARLARSPWGLTAAASAAGCR